MWAAAPAGPPVLALLGTPPSTGDTISASSHHQTLMGGLKVTFNDLLSVLMTTERGGQVRRTGGCQASTPPPPSGR